MGLVIEIMFCVVMLSFALNFLLIRVLYKEHINTCDRLMAKNIDEFKKKTVEPTHTIVESQHKKMIEKWRNKGNE